MQHSSLAQFWSLSECEQSPLCNLPKMEIIQNLKSWEFLAGKIHSGDFLAISWAKFGHQILYWRKLSTNEQGEKIMEL
jgi:hypothetical protein